MFTEVIDYSNITLITFLLVFLAGIFTSFTPCVYPLIPITIGFIGAKSTGSKWRGFILSVFYVLGLSLVYSSLGVFVVISGHFFGAFIANPITMIVLANFYILLALLMLGVFNFQFSLKSGEKIRKVTAKRGKKDLLASFLVGAASALAAGPCTAPVLGGLLIWIGKSQNVVVGASLMFVFSFGMGILLILVGTFAGLASSLPRAGKWMKFVKIFFALCLFGVA